jgi:hypothetical protein
MTARQLLTVIQAGLADGTLDPDALVVRPFCCCDHDNGYTEAQHLDQLFLRRRDLEPDLDGTHGPERFCYGLVCGEPNQWGGQCFSAADGTNPEDRRVVKLG